MGKIQSGVHTRFYIRYHFVWIVKYRKDILFRPGIDKSVKDLFFNICERYGFELESFATDGNHVHLFVGAFPRYSPARVAEILKSISAKGIFKKHLDVQKELWGGEFWGDGYYVGTVGHEVTEDIVKRYIKDQGHKTKHKPFDAVQLTLF
jgi:putative transposase